MQLSPLQSRLVASIAASLLLLLLYLSLFSPNFALASEVLYAPDFDSIEHDFLENKPPEITALVNNVPRRISLAPGRSARFVFDSIVSHPPHDDLLEQDTAQRTVFVSANTCQRPDFESQGSAWNTAPQLELSVSAANPNLLSTSAGLGAATIEFEDGAVMHKVTITDAVYITVTAPSALSGFSGLYSVEIAASVDNWFHSYQEDESPQLTLIARDSNTAILRTRDLGLDETPDDINSAQQALEGDPPYVMFVDEENSPRLNGIRRSFCGLKTYAQMSSHGGDGNSGAAATSIVGPGLLGQPGHQFHFRDLDAGRQYNGILVHTGRRGLIKREEGQVGGGGHVFRPRQFKTNLSKFKIT